MDLWHDEGLEVYPRGTDFASLATSFEHRYAEWRKENEPPPTDTDPVEEVEPADARPTGVSGWWMWSTGCIAGLCLVWFALRHLKAKRACNR